MNVLKPLGFAVLGAALAAAAYGNVPPPPASAKAPPLPTPPAPPAWEYTIHLGPADAKEFNRLGADGWELATSYYHPPNGPPTHAFKRPRR